MLFLSQHRQSILSVAIIQLWPGRSQDFLGRHLSLHNRGNQQWPLDLHVNQRVGIFPLSNSFWKNGLKEARITLCASNCWPSSPAKVTSLKCLSSLSFPKAISIFSWKSFQSLVTGQVLGDDDYNQKEASSIFMVAIYHDFSVNNPI